MRVNRKALPAWISSYIGGESKSHIEILEAQLHQQNSVVDQLGDGLEVALFICDAKATILYANRSALDLFGFEAPVGRPLLAVTLSTEMESMLLRAVETQDPQSGELRFTSPVEKVGRVKIWPQRDAPRLFVSVYDITELRRLERIRRDFVSNVSHELRTPLTIIRSMAETLLDSPEETTAKREKYLSKVVEEVDRLALMANDLLVLTSAESQPVQKAHSDLAEVFRSAVDQLQPKAAEKQLDLRFSGPDSLLVPADSEQMRQVALNLVENALKYTSQGEVMVNVREEADDFVATVADTGQGISTEDVAKIFERFYRVDRGRSRQTGGTGLGLSIVKHIVESHGGQVHVDTALNIGSTFTVRLPLADRSILPSAKG